MEEEIIFPEDDRAAKPAKLMVDDKEVAVVWISRDGFIHKANTPKKPPAIGVQRTSIVNSAEGRPASTIGTASLARKNKPVQRTANAPKKSGTELL